MERLLNTLRQGPPNDFKQVGHAALGVGSSLAEVCLVPQLIEDVHSVVNQPRHFRWLQLVHVLEPVGDALTRVVEMPGEHLGAIAGVALLLGFLCPVLELVPERLYSRRVELAL